MRKWVALMMTALLCAEAYIGFTDLFPKEAKGTAVLIVPELVGSKISNDDEFQFIIAYQLDESTEPGTVLTQKPSGGTAIKVQPGEARPTVTVTVARGRMEYAVEDYRGRDVREVREELALQGYKVKLTAAEGETDKIVATNPAFGEKIFERGEITLFYGAEAEAVSVNIPNLEGMPLIDAVREILASGLYLGDIERTESEETPGGCVISQSPPAGAFMPYRTKVKLYVSNGTDNANNLQENGDN